MKQKTLAMASDQNAAYEQYRKPIVFLATMERVVLWKAVCSAIEPHYPKASNGRPPARLQRMLRMYFVQHWFNRLETSHAPRQRLAQEQWHGSTPPSREHAQ